MKLITLGLIGAAVLVTGGLISTNVDKECTVITEVTAPVSVIEKRMSNYPFDIIKATLQVPVDLPVIQPKDWGDQPKPEPLPPPTPPAQPIIRVNNGCSPGGIRKDFWVSGVKHWRCIY